VKNASELLINARAVKTPDEINRLKEVNQVAEVGLRKFEHILRSGLSEIELAALIEHEIVTVGITERKMNRIIACAFVSSGPNTAEAYKFAFGNTRRKVRQGELAMVELDVVADGYSSDTTRTCVVGKPTMQQKNLLEAVLCSQGSAVSAIKPGCSAAEIARISNDVIRRYGFAKYLVHGLGHGIGVAIHEPIPTLHLASKHVLQSGMVHSVEPGIYGRKIGGIRMEDDILDTDRGAEYLSMPARMPE
jgi:Xaa-Pro aminopeptidase